MQTQPSERVRILVVGDSSVGKSSLVHLICHEETLRYPTWTVGANIELKLHEHTTTKKPYWVEFIDMGGTSHHASSRSVFYHHLSGIILVHDLTNKNTYSNLYRWMDEVLHSASFCEQDRKSLQDPYPSSPVYDFELKIGQKESCIPVLVVGCKQDVCPEFHSRFSIAEDYGGKHILMSALQVQQISPDHPTKKALDAFFDSVIDREHGLSDTAYPSYVGGLPSQAPTSSRMMPPLHMRHPRKTSFNMTSL